MTFVGAFETTSTCMLLLRLRQPGSSTVDSSYFQDSLIGPIEVFQGLLLRKEVNLRMTKRFSMLQPSCGVL